MNTKKILKKITEVSLILKLRFLRSRVSAGIFLLFFTYSTHQTTYENLLKTWLILEIKFDLELAIFKVKGLRKFSYYFFHIQRVKLHRNTEIPSQTFMKNETNFLHCTLRCLRGWSLYRPSSQVVGDSTWNIQWFYV